MSRLVPCFRDETLAYERSTWVCPFIRACNCLYLLHLFFFRWEKLFDPSTSAPFWYHTGHATTVWDEPAVCHVCDVEIDDFDVKCFSCQVWFKKIKKSFL